MSIRKNTLLYYAKVVVGLCKITGFGAFSFEDRHSATVKLTDLALFSVNFTLGCSIMHVTLRNNIYTKVEGNLIVYAGNLLAANVGISIALIAMLVYFVRYKSLFKIIAMLDECDEKLLRLEQQVPNIFTVLFFGLMSIGNSLLLVPIAYLMSNSGEMASNIVLFIYAGVYFNISMSVVASGVLCILMRMKCILNALGKHKTSQITASETETLLSLNEIYIDLSELSNEMSSLMGFICMLGFFLCMVYGTFANFAFYKAFFGNNTDSLSKQKALISAIWASFIAIYPILIVVLCDMISFCEQKIVKTLKEMEKRTADEIQHYKLLAFISFIKSFPFRFTCGLFDFTIQQCVAGAGIVLSNMIILIQFDNASKV